MTFALLVLPVFAQNTEMAGRITDEKGNPLAGVTVQSKSGASAVSAADGTFRIRKVNAGETLTFSSVGYTAKTIAARSGADISISLNAASSTLSDVVVVGYGTQSKKAVTGSVVSVGYDQFKDRSFSNVTQALAGQVAGVNITQAQGAPGSLPIIRIRGISSITAGTNPLMVVDGVPLENFNLNMINPQDIESVEVLKDASSAAIYGSRGASGVILVTTKLGKTGKSTVSASYEYATQKVIRKIDLMDAQQWIDFYVTSKNNAWIAAGGKADDPNSVRGTIYKIPEDFITNPQQFGKGTDWQDVMYRVAPSHNAQVSVSGGTEKTQFLFSGGLLKQDAVLDRNYYNRLSIRSNIRHKVSEKVNIGLNLGFTGINERTEGTLGKSDVIGLALQNDPIFPVYNEIGNLGFADPGSTWNKFLAYGDFNQWHPYGATRETKRQNKSFNTLGTAFLEYAIIKDLKFRTSISGNLSNGGFNYYQNKNQGYGFVATAAATGTTSSSYMLNWLTENTLNYNKQFGDHSIGILAGYTAQKQKDEFSTLTSGNFPNDLVQTLNAGSVTSGSSSASEWSMLSYLARVNYNFRSKYYLTGTIRRDGSSRFGENNKWGYFPSMSAGWVASDEPFLQNSKTIDFLKLRASYGLAGNNQIPNYGAISLLTASNRVNGNSVANGLMIGTSANPDLRWEKTTQFNLGFDMRLLDSRISISADVYNSITRDMLLNVPVPDITGFSTQLTNIGRMRNKGFELSVTSKNITGKFNWTTDANFSMNRNTVLQLGPGNAPLIYTDFAATVKTEVGQPVSNFYGYIFDGVFKNQAEVDAYPHHPTTTPGDPRVRDINGDKVIDQNDRTTIGNFQPDFIAGLTNTFSYKGLDLSFMLQGSFGGEIVNQLVRFNGFWNNGRQKFASVANFWRSETNPGDGIHFKPSIAAKGLQNQFSSYWVEDASFVRIKNIRISYALPANVLGKTPLKNLRVYVNAENVHLFSDYSNYDPENTTYNATSFSPGTATTSFPTGAFVGVDYGSYPVPRIITFGVKADF
jgi:TonB-linked SusC/RagA family outer membrane protein